MKQKNKMSKVLKTVLFAGIFSLIGCDSEPITRTNSTTTKDSTSTKDSTPTKDSLLVNAEKVRLLSLVNEIRQTGCRCGADSMPPVNPVKWSDTLTSIAKLHSEDMIARAYFSHTTPDGVSFSQRITNGGYLWKGCAENIAAGQTSAESVIAAWKNSPGHCKNIMGGSYTDMGVGRSVNHWTQVFATPRK